MTDAKQNQVPMKIDPKGKATAKTIKQFLDQRGQDFVQVLPSHIPADRFLRVMLSAIMRSPKLQACTVESVIGCLMQSAQLGLELNTPLGLAFLIPYKTTCTFVPGYKGMVDLAYRSGRVSSVTAHVVTEEEYAKGRFAIEYGTETKIEHKPLLDEPEDMRELLGAYAVIALKDGGRVFRFLTMREIFAARPSHWKDTPWNDPKETVREEMYLKTALRRTMKLAPQSPEMAQVIVADEISQRSLSWRYDFKTRESLPTDEQPALAEPPKANPADFARPQDSIPVEDAPQRPPESETPEPTSATMGEKVDALAVAKINALAVAEELLADPANFCGVSREKLHESLAEKGVDAVVLGLGLDAEKWAQMFEAGLVEAEEEGGAK